ncbi:MAG: hypothetical protein ACXWBS_10765, partial [Chthoniobacterales bacterium]
IEMFASACVLSRLDSELQGVSQNGATPDNHGAGELFLRQSFARTRRYLSDLSGNEDKLLLTTADAVLGKAPGASRNGR